MAFPSTYRNVVVAYDGSDGARAALARAAEIADKDDSSLTLVEAVPGKVPSPAPGGPPLAKPERRAMVRDDLNRAIETLSRDLLAAGWVIGGPPASGIVTVAEDIEADLIVTGSRGRGEKIPGVACLHFVYQVDYYLRRGLTPGYLHACN